MVTHFLFRKAKSQVAKRETVAQGNVRRYFELYSYSETQILLVLLTHGADLASKLLPREIGSRKQYILHRSKSNLETNLHFTFYISCFSSFITCIYDKFMTDCQFIPNILRIKS